MHLQVMMVSSLSGYCIFRCHSINLSASFLFLIQNFYLSRLSSDFIWIKGGSSSNKLSGTSCINWSLWASSEILIIHNNFGRSWAAISLINYIDLIFALFIFLEWRSHCVLYIMWEEVIAKLRPSKGIIFGLLSLLV
jgi:hypothetical protein